MPGPRKLRPREPIAPMPVLITQINCKAVIGVDERRYLEQVVPLCKGHVASVGKLRAVPVGVVLDVMARLAASEGAHVQDSSDDDSDDAPTTADEVLARLGMKRAG